MKLNEQGLKDRLKWEEAEYSLPKFDRGKVMAATKENPFWIHFGAGNIFRAFQANVVQNLLNEGILDKGLVVAEGFDYEIVEKMNRPHDDYTLLVTLKADGNVDKTVVGSVVESLILDSENEKEYERLKEIFRKDSLQMVSFTITEKGYSLVNGKGEVLPAVAEDLEKGPEKPMSYIGKVVSLLYTRYQAGEKPVAMVSMDNCSRNGDKLYAAVKEFALKWAEKGLADKGFLAYVNTKEKVSFPWTMIDKITPRPDASVEAILKADGIEGLEPVITSKNTYVAPFVNAEECEYLVIEDAFPNGKPDLEKGGVMFTERETVDKVEKMKVCTCLNPLHTALAVYGCLLGYKKISEEMKDAELTGLIETIGYKEGLPVVVDPGILDPKEFIDTVLKVRFPNPFMPDTPQRIATDTSQKLAIRYGETIKAYQASPKLNVKDLKLIPLVFAGWLRYLMGVDDEGNAFEISPDPLKDTVCPYVAGLKLEEGQEVEAAVGPLLKMKQIFGVDLYEAGLADKVCGYLKEMTKGVGAVRATLKKYVLS
ncbi:mannitol dehydrogenase family protein [Parablautia muri]|uniref:Mannitol dehydrogenase family protein n=1 Tax=Parablautia muri TaxID=2320879 RepID=A0A9X5BH86_9FIRM|nr:mannitol dehydrogenase family protein [Parablautia muri]NBJ94009.1 mannitol dehydrogenase family protein [Parablautia muri]